MSRRVHGNARALSLGPFAAAWLAVFLLAIPAFSDPPKSTDRYLMYQLSYTDLPRAVALLKTFGYTVKKAGDPPAAEEQTEYNRSKRPLIFALEDPTDSEIVNSGVTAGKLALTVTELKEMSSAAPHQRLLIQWTEDEPGPGELQKLVDLLREQIDVAARQILVEAMVLELDTGHLSQLGFAYSGAKDGNAVSFLENSSDGSALPLVYQFTRPSAKTFLEFSTALKALVDDNKGKLLSRPSVLVLDGHQAVITIGDKVPYSRLVRAQELSDDGTFTGLDLGDGNVITKTEYLNVDLTLNIQPRASEDGSQVTMQVETLISTAENKSTVTDTGAVIGPPLVTRVVETNVRVANDTPFVIGGLIRTSSDLNRGGVPYLSRIPLLGKLFQRTNRNTTSKEVVVIIIPHVIPLEDLASGFTIAKDSDLFDHFDLSLFRNVYRVKTEDIFDLDFIRESEFMQALERWVEGEAFKIYGEAYVRHKADSALRAAQETATGQEQRAVPTVYPSVSAGDRLGLASQLRRLSEDSPALLDKVRPNANLALLIDMVNGATPGEDKLVKRMLLELIEKQRFGPLERQRYIDYVAPGSIRFFPESSGSGPILELEKLIPHFDKLDRGSCATLELHYKRKTLGDHTFDPPVASVTAHPSRPDTDESLLEMLRQINVLATGGSSWEQSGILLDKCYPSSGGRSLWEHLKGVLVLKRLLDLNPTLPLTLDGFHVGLDIVFPTQQDLEQRQHIVDRETAALFYETLDYYYAFERTIRCVLKAPELAGFVGDRRPKDEGHPDCLLEPTIAETPLDASAPAPGGLE